MRQGRQTTALKHIRYSLLSIAAATVFSTSVNANPNGASIVHGSVSINNGIPGVTSITNSPNAIINWQGFNINQNEVTRFIQQNSQSAVLNRVIGADPSQIMGQLLSNGQVYLINPNGILFGANSVIDTAGFLASTLNLSNEDFLSGNYHFIAGDSAGDINNQGIIRTGEDGNIILIAPNIENSGIISTEGGKITLAAGESLTVTSLDNPGISFEVQAPDNNILNVGQILTNGGAAHLFANTITHSGEINANSVEVDEQGQVWLVAKDTLMLTEDSITSADNSAGKAGSIRLLGDKVGLIDQAHVTADGQSGGGEILIGGDYQGAGPDIQNATASYVGKDVSISADAITSDDGGKVIVWSDEVTRMYGRISATAGTKSGDGGFIEVSGKKDLLYRGSVDASSPTGLAGSVLFDPKNIIIAIGGGDVIDTTPPGNVLFSELPSATVTFTPADIKSILDTGTALTLQANNDITVNDDIIVNEGGAGGNFTLTAGRSIYINADIFTDNGDFIAYANSTGAGFSSSDRDAGQADLILAAGNFINTGTAVLQLIMHDVTTAGEIQVGGSLLVNGTTSISLLNAAAGQRINLLSTAVVDNPGWWTYFTADDLNFASGAAITGNGLVITPSTSTGVSMSIAGGTTGAGFLDLSATEMDAIQVGLVELHAYGEMNIGSYNTASNRTYRFFSFDDMTLEGSLSLNGSVEMTVDSDGNSDALLDIQGALSAINFVELFGVGGGDTFRINNASANTIFSVNGGAGANPDILDITPNASVQLDSINLPGFPGSEIIGIEQIILTNSDLSGIGNISGDITLNGTSNLSGSGSVTGNITLNGGTLSTSGLITGNVINQGGTITPGGAGAIGTIQIQGDFTQTSGIVNIEVENAGLAAGTGYDLLEIIGDVTLGSNLRLLPINAYTPADNDTLTPFTYTGVRTGVFSVINSTTNTDFTDTYNELTPPSNLTLVLNTVPSGTIFQFNVQEPDGTYLWSEADNWGGSVPVDGTPLIIPDFIGSPTIIFDASAGTVAPTDLTASEMLAVTGGSLIFADDSSFIDLAITGGTFGATGGVLDVAGDFDWTGGSLVGGADLDLTGATGVYIDNVVLNGMNLLMSSIVSPNTTIGTLTIAAGGSIDHSGDVLIDVGETVNMQGGTVNISGFDPRLDISGTLNWSGGAINLIDLSVGTPTFNVNTGGILNIGGTVTSATDVDLLGGTLTGIGNLIANVTNDTGNLSVGSPVGLLTIGGALTMNPGSSTTMDITGLIPGVEYDFINVGGAVILDGLLNIITTPYVNQAVGDSFNFIQSDTSIAGSFASLTMTSGYSYVPSVVATVFNLLTTEVSTNISDVQQLVSTVLTADIISLLEQSTIPGVDPIPDPVDGIPPPDNTGLAIVPSLSEVLQALITQTDSTDDKQTDSGQSATDQSGAPGTDPGTTGQSTTGQGTTGQSGTDQPGTPGTGAGVTDPGTPGERGTDQPGIPDTDSGIPGESGTPDLVDTIEETVTAAAAEAGLTPSDSESADAVPSDPSAPASTGIPGVDIFPPTNEPSSGLPLPDVKTVSLTDALDMLDTGSYTLADKATFFKTLTDDTVVSSFTRVGQIKLARFYFDTAEGGDTDAAELTDLLEQIGVPLFKRIGHLGIFIRMRHIGMNKILAKALEKLEQDPNAADEFDDGESGGDISIELEAPSVQTSDGLARVKGKITSKSRLLYLGINGQWAYVDPDGNFDATVPVKQGQSQLALEAKDIAGAKATANIAVNSSRTGRTSNVEGKRIGLFIGVEQYKDEYIPDLETPLNDARTVAKRMAEDQGFETRILKDPGKKEILDSLLKLSEELGENDTLMVFYAGHGYQLEDTGRGFWIPADAGTEDPKNWVSNRDVARLFHRTRAKQIMLVSDSCYSGTFTLGDQPKDATKGDTRNLRAVMAMSSGGEEPVWDGGGGNHSIFASKFLDTIKKGDITGLPFYQQVREKVVKDAPQVPGYGAMTVPGYDQGADYILK